MNKARLFSILAMCMFFSGAVWGQKQKLQKANTEFNNYNYTVAIPLYQEILEKTDLPEAKINLAECFKKVGNTTEAEYWYGQVVHLPDAKPKHFLFYGMALQANGKCDLAKEWFLEYAKLEPSDLRGQLLAKTCEPQELQRLLKKSEKLYELYKLPINSQYDDFSPVYYKDGLVFASERDKSGLFDRTYEWTGYPFLELYFSEVDTVDGENLEFSYQQEATKYHKEINTKYHDGPISFSPDYQKVYITRNNFYKRKTSRGEDGIVRLKIFIGDYEDGKWTNLKDLSFNSDEYSVAHPALSADGKMLYFASDMPGGFGGMDLYSSEFDESTNNWGPPKNLGPRINTEGHEVFPYIHYSTGKLYFASDGHIGLGKLDIHYVQKIDEVWGPVTNAGAPLNSNADDFGVILNEEETFGYFTSNRTGGVGRDDIYSFKKSVVKAKVIVYDKNTDEPIPAANVFNDCSLESYVMDKKGEAIIELPLNECCNLTANKEAYIENKVEQCTDGNKAGDEIVVRIPLTMPLDFVLEGVVTDAKTGDPISLAIVRLENDCDEDVREFVTAEDGRYHFDDLEMDCCYFVSAKKVPVYFASDSTRVCTRGKTKSEVFVVDIQLQSTVDKIYVDPNDTTYAGRGTDTLINPSDVDPKKLTGGQLHPPAFRLEHIYYNFDKHYIRDDAEPELTELLDLLNRNPEYIVEIGSHTDARGSRTYNQWLSRKRAEAVVDWLVNQGIPKERLRRKGYGEEVPTNECVDYVECDEEKHQRNRRTEFTVVGTVDGLEFARSVAPPTVMVDECNGCPF